MSGLLDRIMDKLADVVNNLKPSTMFSVGTKTSDNIAITANGYHYGTMSASNPGYYPLGIVGRYLQYVSGAQGRVNIYELELISRSSGSCEVAYSLQNLVSSAVTTKIRVYILWAKE